jgi:hypothetical protein
MIPYFGISKWSKQLATHFWIESKQKQYFLSLTEKLKGKVSFFYPCSKFPEAVRLLCENGSACNTTLTKIIAWWAMIKS